MAPLAPKGLRVWWASRPQGKEGPTGKEGERGKEGEKGKEGLQGKEGKGREGIEGKEGIEWKKAYESGVIYLLHQAVSYAGSSYISIKAPNVGRTPLEWVVQNLGGK